MHEDHESPPEEFAPVRTLRKCPRCGARAVESSGSGLCWCGSCGEEIDPASLTGDGLDSGTGTEGGVPQSAMILAGGILGGIIGAIIGIFLELPALAAGITGAVLGAVVGAFSRGET